MIAQRPTRPAAASRAFFIAEALLGLALVTIIAAAAIGAIRLHMRAIAFDAQRKQALLAVEQSLEQLRSRAAPQSPAAFITIATDPAPAPTGYRWIRASARNGNQSTGLFALVPTPPSPPRAPQ